MNELTVEIFAEGKWNGMQFDRDDLNAIAAAFHSLGDNMRVPLKFGHNDDQPMTDGYPALGWVSDVWVEGEKLLAKFTDVPKTVFNAIEARLYRNVSIELESGVEWKGQYFSMVLSGVALLGADIPAVNVLADLQAYMSKQPAQFKSERKLKFSYTQEVDTVSEELKKQLEELMAKNAKLEQDSLHFKKQAEDTQKEIKRQKFESQKTALFSRLDAGVQSGVITPADRDKFMSNFSDESEEANKALMFSVETLIPAVGSKNDGNSEKSKSSTQHDTEQRASDLLFKKAKRKALESNLSFSVARDIILEDDQDLAQRWKNENAGGM